MTIREQFINLAQRQVGYKEDKSKGANWTKYARWFDNEAWQWFNTKKQNSEWCAVFVCWLFAQNEILGPKKALTFLGCPSPKYNCAAGCGYLYDYMKSKGYKSSVENAKPGDIIFFKNGNKCSHVGMIEKVDSVYLYTIEGNVSNMVKRCKRKRSAKTTIFGIMSPDWETAEKLKKTTSTLPVIVDNGIQTNTSNVHYIVNTNSDPLRLRSGPGANYPTICNMKKGSEVIYKGITKGDWMLIKYKSMSGYAFSKYLKRK